MRKILISIDYFCICKINTVFGRRYVKKALSFADTPFFLIFSGFFAPFILPSS